MKTSCFIAIFLLFLTSSVHATVEDSKNSHPCEEGFSIALQRFNVLSALSLQDIKPIWYQPHGKRGAYIDSRTTAIKKSHSRAIYKTERNGDGASVVSFCGVSEDGNSFYIKETRKIEENIYTIIVIISAVQADEKEIELEGEKAITAKILRIRILQNNAYIGTWEPAADGKKETFLVELISPKGSVVYKKIGNKIIADIAPLHTKNKPKKRKQDE